MERQLLQLYRKEKKDKLDENFRKTRENFDTIQRDLSRLKSRLNRAEIELEKTGMFYEEKAEL